MEALIAMKIIVKEGDVYCLVLKDSDTHHPLPDPARTTITIERNWTFPSRPSPIPLCLDEGQAEPSLAGPSRSKTTPFATPLGEIASKCELYKHFLA